MNKPDDPVVPRRRAAKSRLSNMLHSIAHLSLVKLVMFTVSTSTREKNSRELESSRTESLITKIWRRCLRMRRQDSNWHSVATISRNTKTLQLLRTSPFRLKASVYSLHSSLSSTGNLKKAVSPDDYYDVGARES